MYKETELKVELARQGTTKSKLAKRCGMQESTFFRKSINGKWYIGEVDRISKELHLTNERMCEIFFA